MSRIHVERSLLDRAIGTISPGAELRRYEARVKLEAASRFFGRGGYDGGKSDRPALREYRPMSGDADDAISADLPSLRDRAQDLARNNGIVAGALSTHAMSIVGPGLVPHPRIDRDLLGLSEAQAEAWQLQAERIFWAWGGTTSCDLTRRANFLALTSLVVRSWFESGDLIAIRRFKARKGDLLALKIQLVEAGRVSNPDYRQNTDRLIDGVEIDDDGAEVAIHVADRYPVGGYGMSGPAVWKRVDVYGADSGLRQVLHIYKQDRPGQTRGVPIFAPVIETLKQLSRLSEAELMASVINAFFTVFIKSDTGDDSDMVADMGTPGTQPVTPAGSSVSDIRLGSGSIVGLGKGESIEAADPKRPNANFDPFFRSFLSQVGVAVDLPHELLIKHFTASYSASRGAILEAWRGFNTRRSWLIDLFCQPAYEWMIGEAVARGYLSAPGFFENPLVRAAWCEAQWTGPTQGQLDPLSEMNALEKSIDLRLRSRQEIATEQYGTDWNRTVAQLGKERKTLEELGLDSEDVSQRFGAVLPPGQAAPAANPAGSGNDDVDQKDREEMEQGQAEQLRVVLESIAAIPAALASLQLPTPHVTIPAGAIQVSVTAPERAPMRRVATMPDGRTITLEERPVS